MKPRILLVNPPIHDFAAYDFWLKPYGRLRVAGLLRRRAPTRSSSRTTSSWGTRTPSGSRSSRRCGSPARGPQPAVRLTWYDGGLVPARPEELDEGQPLSEWSGGLLFVGEKGKMLCDFVGTNPRLIPASKMKAYAPPPKTLPRSIGHKEEWIRACQGGETPGANFQVAGHVSEILALGNIALGVGKELRWDAPAMKVTNVPEATPYVRRPYREGWTL